MYGGDRVEPIHVTIDRVAAGHEDAVRRVVRECATRLHPVAVRVNAVFGLPSKYRGAVVKLDVPRDPEIDRAIAAVKTALRAAGAPSLYGPERWAAVTALERVDRAASDTAEPLATPVELFGGDSLILSRIAGPSRYEILESARMVGSG